MTMSVRSSSLLSRSKSAPERLGLALGDARRRLVEQQQPRLQRDEAGDLGDAPGAGRQLLDLLVAVAVETHPVDELVGQHGLAALLAAQAEQREEARRVDPLERQPHALEHGERREQRGVLERADQAVPAACLRSRGR